jgi:hypothetical protein
MAIRQKTLQWSVINIKQGRIQGNKQNKKRLNNYNIAI